MQSKFWSLTIVGSITGAMVIMFGLFTTSGAPQQCALIALGLSFAAIPYCLARAVAEVIEHKNIAGEEREKNTEKVIITIVLTVVILLLLRWAIF